MPSPANGHLQREPPLSIPKTNRQPSNAADDGLQTTTLRMRKQLHRAMKLLSVTESRTLQDLFDEALTDLVAKYQKPSKGGNR